MFCGRRGHIIFKTAIRLYHLNIRNMKILQLSQTGDRMPSIGLGTWQAPSEVIENIVYKSLDLGYRHIDTAFNYNNEEAIGKAIKKWIDDGKGSRQDIFVTTKLPHIGNRASDVKRFVDLQLLRLQLNYIDLYLIHVPFAFVSDPRTLTPCVESNGQYVLDLETDHVATWKVMEECQNEGLIRNLGLSNFNEKQIRKIMDRATIKPQVLQVELHGYFQQRELRKFCAENNIVVMAYAPLGSPTARAHFTQKYNYRPDAFPFPNLLEHPVVQDIGEQYSRTPAQILLHFLVKENVAVIPKSVNDLRLKENLDIYDFEVSPQDMDRLRKLDKGTNGRIFNFLFWKGVENHPEYPFERTIYSPTVTKQDEYVVLDSV